MKTFVNLFDDFEKLATQIWSNLESSAGEPDQPWSLAQFASLSKQGPELRTLVLRRCEPESRTLTWHTDLRSPKCQQILKDCRTSVLFWDPAERVQLTLRGTSVVRSIGPRVDEAWEQSKLISRRAYLGSLSPGTRQEQMCVNFPKEFADSPPSEEESEEGKTNFGVITTRIQEMDLVILRQSGNVRAKFYWNAEESGEGNWEASWVCP